MTFVNLKSGISLLFFRISRLWGNQADGRGFDVAQNPSGMGLNNMRERAKAVGATLELASSAGEGTTIILAKRLNR